MASLRCYIHRPRFDQHRGQPQIDRLGLSLALHLAMLPQDAEAAIVPSCYRCCLWTVCEKSHCRLILRGCNMLLYFAVTLAQSVMTLWLGQILQLRRQYFEIRKHKFYGESASPSIGSSKFMNITIDQDSRNIEGSTAWTGSV